MGARKMPNNFVYQGPMHPLDPRAERITGTQSTRLFHGLGQSARQYHSSAPCAPCIRKKCPQLWNRKSGACAPVGHDSLIPRIVRSSSHDVRLGGVVNVPVANPHVGSRAQQERVAVRDALVKTVDRVRGSLPKHQRRVQRKKQRSPDV